MIFHNRQAWPSLSSGACQPFIIALEVSPVNRVVSIGLLYSGESMDDLMFHGRDDVSTSFRDDETKERSRGLLTLFITRKTQSQAGGKPH